MNPVRNDFLAQYKAISSKLKKRFLRKPNVSEASAKFGELARELELEECPHYAAFCCLAIARCENTLGNALEESQTLVKAARLFLESEELNHELLCPSFSENLNAALSCYNHAIKVYLDQNQTALASSLSLEVGKALEHLGRAEQAVPHYQTAASLQRYCVMDYLHTLQLIANCRIKYGELDGALNTLTEICLIAEERIAENLKTNGVIGIFSSVLADAEILKVLLLLLLQPNPQRLAPSNVKTLEKYSWEAPEHENPNYMSEELFILMQSFVISCQSKDLDSIRFLKNDLWFHLTPKQNDLLHKVVEKLNNE